MKLRKFLKLLFNCKTFILVLVFIYVNFCITNCEMCVIDGDSMLPTLYNKQIVFIDKNPKYFYKNEIVVVNNNGMIIKRIKGVEGDAYYTTQDPTMYILDKVMIEFNGKEFEHFVKKKIPHDYYYILGDNQANSYDSKFFGLVSKKQIVGVVYK